MKTKTLLFTNFAILLCINAYTQDYFEASSSANYAYSHNKKAYDSNNLDHLIQYSERAYEAFVKTRDASEKCGCDIAYNKAYDAVNLISKAINVTKWEDGRFYVKKSRALALEIIDAIDLCSLSTEEETDSELTKLQQEQEALKQQQIELQKKSQVIKNKLAIQEKETISQEYKTVLNAYIDNANNMLAASNCESTLLSNFEEEDITSSTMDNIHLFYKKATVELSEKFSSLMKACQ